MYYLCQKEFFFFQKFIYLFPLIDRHYGGLHHLNSEFGKSGASKKIMQGFRIYCICLHEDLSNK